MNADADRLTQSAQSYTEFAEKYKEKMSSSVDYAIPLRALR